MRAIVFGVGGLCAAYMKDRYDSRVFDIVAFSDSDSRKWGKEYYGKKIIPPSQINIEKYDVVVVTSSFYEVIREVLVADYQVMAEKIIRMETLEMSDVAKRYRTYNEKYNKKVSGLDTDNKRIAVYTAITGNYDELKEPLYISERCDYICFTDDMYLSSNGWNIRLIHDQQKDFVSTARKVKICPHEFLADYDYSIWVDAKFLIKGDLLEIWEKYSCGSAMMNFLHYVNNNVKSQARIIVNSGVEKEEIVEAQLSAYQKEDGFDQNELIESGCIFRKHRSPDVIKVMQMWWNEVNTKSHRDQMSINYCLWKNNFIYDVCPLHLYANHYLENTPHRRKK